MEKEKLITLAHKFNFMLDEGYDMPIERIKVQIEDEYLFEYIKAKTIREHFDVSNYSAGELDWLMKEFGKMAEDSVLEDKIRVCHNGLSVLLGYTLELIRRAEN